MRISERADRFAARLRPPAQADDRSADEKLADFMRKHPPTQAGFLRNARRRKENR